MDRLERWDFDRQRYHRLISMVWTLRMSVRLEWMYCV